MPPRLRLVTDEPEIDPPAPLPISAWRTPGRVDADETLDSIAEVEKAIGRVQSNLHSLIEQLDHAEPFPFPRRGDDDDGPHAA